MKPWLRVLLFVTATVWLFAIILRLRPELVQFSRWQGWQLALQDVPPESRSFRFPLPPAVSAFADRVAATKLEPGETPSFYRRHEKRDGIDAENEVPTSLRLGWRFENLNIALHTASKATPAVDETGVYVGGDDGWFYAFDHQGRLRWRFHTANSLRGIHTTAVLTKERVCFGSYGGTYYCLRKSDGEVIWSMNSLRSAFGSSALLADGELLMGIETTFPVNGFIAKFRFDDGKMIWQSDWLGEQIHSSLAYDRENQRAYFGANNSLVRAIDTRTGILLWQTDVGGPVKDTPLLTEKGLYVTSWGKVLTRINPENGQVIWKAELGAASRSSPTRIPGSEVIIVGCRTGLLGIQAESGKVLWRKDTDVEIASSALAVREPRTGRWLAWISCGEAQLCAFDAAGKQVARFELPGRLTGIPVAYNHGLYLALDFPGGLVRLESGELSKNLSAH